MVGDDVQAPTKQQRHLTIYSALHSLFPRDRNTLLVPYPNRQSSSIGIHVLIDWSNIAISSKEYFALHEKLWGLPSTYSKIDTAALDLVLVRGRRWRSKFVCGSVASQDMREEEQLVVEHLSLQGYEVMMTTRMSRVVNGRWVNSEQYVDESLCGRILDVISNNVPGSLVLATGDGQPTASDRKLGFLSSIEESLRRGWSVELYSFGKSLSRNWRDLLSKYPKTFSILYLDEFALALRL